MQQIALEREKKIRTVTVALWKSSAKKHLKQPPPLVERREKKVQIGKRGEEEKNRERWTNSDAVSGDNTALETSLVNRKQPNSSRRDPITAQRQRSCFGHPLI